MPMKKCMISKMYWEKLMSTISKYSTNIYNSSYHSPSSKFLNNMSQISIYSNYCHNKL